MALGNFLEELGDLELAKEVKQSLEATQGNSASLADAASDLCPICNLTIEDECAKNSDRRWHLSCLSCANCGRELKHHVGDAVLMTVDHRTLCRTCASNVQGSRQDYEYISKLKQYIFLLKVALARLLLMLRQGGNLPHTSGRSNTPFSYLSSSLTSR